MWVSANHPICLNSLLFCYNVFSSIMCIIYWSSIDLLANLSFTFWMDIICDVCRERIISAAVLCLLVEAGWRTQLCPVFDSTDYSTATTLALPRSDVIMPLSVKCKSIRLELLLDMMTLASVSLFYRFPSCPNYFALPTSSASLLILPNFLPLLVSLWLL